MAYFREIWFGEAYSAYLYFRALLEKLSMDKVYLSRDPRSIVAEMLTTEKLTEESVQAFSNELCGRVKSFNDHQTTSHHTYQVYIM